MFAPQGWLQGKGNRRVYRTISESGFFDKAWYRRGYLWGLWKLTDPIWHYIRRGWHQASDPSPRFDTGFYLASNRDVRESAINPLDHYLSYGSAEGRPALMPLAQWWPQDLSSLQPIKFYTARLKPRQRISLVIDANTPRSWRGDQALFVLVAQWLGSHHGRDTRILLRNGLDLTYVDHALFHAPQNHNPIQATQVPEGSEYSDIDRHDDEIFIATSWSSATSIHNSFGGQNLIYLVTSNEAEALPVGDTRILAQRALALPDTSYLLMAGIDSDNLWPDGSKPKKFIDSMELSLGSFMKSPRPATPGGPIVIWAGNDAVAHRVRSILLALEQLIARGSLDPAQHPVSLVGEAAQRVLLLGTHQVFANAPKSLTEELHTIQGGSLVIAITGSSKRHSVALCATQIGVNVLPPPSPSASITDLSELIHKATAENQAVEVPADSAKLKAIANFVQECGKRFSL
jgi:hypothetical protein